MENETIENTNMDEIVEKKEVVTEPETKQETEPVAKPNDGNSIPKMEERVVPDEYNLNLPEDSVIDAEHQKDIVEFAKANKLTEKEAQAILDRDNAFKAAMIKGQQEELEKVQAGWVEETKKDGEIGGDNYDESVVFAKRFLKKFATPAFMEMLENTKYGNHPEVIRVFSRGGKEYFKDAEFVRPSAVENAKRAPEDIFYPSNSKK